MISEWFQMFRSTDSDTTTYKVLVASDDAAAAALINNTLGQNNYSVGATRTVNETLPLLDEMRPDVLICDFVRPEIDGKQLLEAARLRLGKSGMPAVLFLRDTQEDEATAHEMGVDDLILKPFDSQVLLDSIARLAAARAGVVQRKS